ncbi:hypothetical protein [uncultured Actinomyces sp.]|uniref:variant leucine-rich repeat-containing protein n=1 Tax=uncultured Actinomyces sp. TaxID=249061 RepID=UPI002635A8D7|nr:hypothetical protein [uncultured Actinomyces sp.]
MNTDPKASSQRPDLAQVAADPATNLEVLRTLAFEYPKLRPVIALNPSAYPGLLEWLGEFDDEALKAALKQREESGPVYPSASVAAPLAAGAESGASSQTPAQNVAEIADAGEEDSPQHSTKKGLIVAIVLLVIAIPLVFVAAKLLVGTPNAPESASSTATSAGAEATAIPSDTQASEEVTTAAELKYPAPGEAADLELISAPSGNILCKLADGSVACTVLQTQEGMRGGACEEGFVTVVATAEGVKRDCSLRVNAQGATKVDYGQFGQTADVACGSQYNGISCWNMKTGQGFAVSRQGWTTTDKGYLSEEQFPWVQ